MSSVIQIHPLTLAASQRHLKEWTDLTAIKPLTHMHTESQFYFVARDRFSEGRDWIEVKIDREGYMVDGSRYHDIWKRPVVKEYEWTHEWQNIDSISLGGDED